MAIPLKNAIYDRVKEAGSITDVGLYKALTKGGLPVSEDRYNKLLLDLEIMGLIRVAWITKDEKRIEAVEEQADAAGRQDDAVTEKGYEASFPGFEK